MHFVKIQPVGIRFRQSSGPPARRGSVPDAQPVRLRTSVRSFAERGPRLASHTSEPACSEPVEPVRYPG